LEPVQRRGEARERGDGDVVGVAEGALRGGQDTMRVEGVSVGLGRLEMLAAAGAELLELRVDAPERAQERHRAKGAVLVVQGAAPRGRGADQHLRLAV